MTVYVLCLVIFAIGLLGALTQKNLIKIIIGLAISSNAANLLFILVGYRFRGRAPIQLPGLMTDYAGRVADFDKIAVDPFPQAMVLTSIVIELGVLALLLAIALRIYQCYGTYDISEIRRLRG